MGCVGMDVVIGTFLCVVVLSSSFISNVIKVSLISRLDRNDVNSVTGIVLYRSWIEFLNFKSSQSNE